MNKPITLTALLLALIMGALLWRDVRAQVPPTDLFFSEYIEGSSNNKALELYNGTGAPIDLAAGGYSVQMFFNGSTTAGLTISLAGTVANGDVFVLAQSSANATILAQADLTNSAGWFNGDDAVVLRRGTTVIDAIGQVGFDQTDSLLDPKKGYRLTALVEPEGSMQDGISPYARLRLDGSAYYPVGKNVIVAGRVRLATIQGVNLDDLAPSRRLYSGGGGSVRGFAYQKLGPLDPNGDPIGGRSLNEAAGEVRYRFGNYGVVAFLDVGQSYAASLPRFSDLRYGVGLGGRLYTNFGPMRVDVATPLNRRKGEARLNIYVSIGQAF